jgi:hypothetical protein
MRNQALQQAHNVLVLQVLLLYVDDKAFILVSPGEVMAASKLIISHFRRFVWLFTLEGREKKKSRKCRPFTFQGQDRNHQLLITSSKSMLMKLYCPFLLPPMVDTVTSIIANPYHCTVIIIILSIYL